MSSFHKLIINRKDVSNYNLSYTVCQFSNTSLNLNLIIFLQTKGKIYKISATLKDSLEHRLKREGYVEGVDIRTQKGLRKPVKMSLYSITPKGRKLLKGWVSFLSAYS